MKIATLNLNGETWFSINRRPRLPKSLFDIQNIKEQMTNLTKNGLERILGSSDCDIDIISVQEFVNLKTEREAIEKSIKSKGYKFLAPEVSARTHFVTGFIVKECEDKKYTLSTSDFSNRQAHLEIECEEKNFSISNIHVKSHTMEMPDGTFLVGDMNACKASQAGDGKGVNEYFLNKIEENYRAANEEKYFTWKSSSVERQLDHIYIKDSERTSFKIIDVKKDDSVNFYYDSDGFTDHSMLTLTFEFAR